MNQPSQLGQRLADMILEKASATGQSPINVLESLASTPDESLRGILADHGISESEPQATPDPHDRTKKVLEAALGYASYGLSVRLITKQLSFEEFLTGQTGLRKLATKLEEVLS